MAEVIGVSSHASAFMPLCLDVAMYNETHPILGTRDIQRAIEFYTQQLGFKLAFGDKADSPNYVGFRRDAVVLHMQFSSSTRSARSVCGFWWRIRMRSSTNIGNAASSALPTAFAIRHGVRANSPSMTWTGTRSPSTET